MRLTKPLKALAFPPQTPPSQLTFGCTLRILAPLLYGIYRFQPTKNLQKTTKPSKNSKTNKKRNQTHLKHEEPLKTTQKHLNTSINFTKTHLKQKNKLPEAIEKQTPKLRSRSALETGPTPFRSRPQVSIGQIFHAVPDAAGGLPLDDYASILAWPGAEKEGVVVVVVVVVVVCFLMFSFCFHVYVYLFFPIFLSYLRLF